MISYLFTVVLSAFLLFVVQPLIGKVILPWFGGSAAVWSTILLFFQFVLLLGYTYSFLVTAHLDRRRQIYVHIGILILSLLIMLGKFLVDGSPLLPKEGLKPTSDTSSIIRIIIILGSSVGLPYFVLSTTGPLLQSWYTKTAPDRSPYWMYALSNAGSFLALLAYPFAIEPLLGVTVQAWVWSLIYVIFGLSVVYIGVRNSHEFTQDAETSTITPKVRIRKKQIGSRRKLASSQRKYGKVWRKGAFNAEEREFLELMGSAAQWFLLAMCTTILLVAVTNQITQDVAPIPLLWVLPLGIYLLSFVISFGIKASLNRISVPLFGIATFAIVYGLSQGNALAAPLQIGIYTGAFFLASLACHGELARLQPEPKLLTAYYLIIAMGGVLGSVLVSVIAPLIFNNYWEFNLGFLICWVTLIGVLYLDRNSFFHRVRRSIALYLLLIAPVTLVLFTGQYLRVFRNTTIESSRNFYGTLRLQELSNVSGWDPFYVLSHGTTIHGMQYKSSDLRKLPIAYFSADSGVGRLLTEINTDSKGKRVGVLGLGVGTLAAYGREQDVYRFYEINPEVVDLAQGKEGYFNYLSNSPAEIDVVLGDARLSLESELATGNLQAYNVLVLDVFSSDAIPVHLLTEECFILYLDHLAPDGVIAAHISTSHVNLKPLLARIAEKFSLHAVLIEDNAVGYPCCQSRWVLLSRTTEWLSLSRITEVSQELGKPENNVRIWTDNYSNPLQILN